MSSFMIILTNDNSGRGYTSDYFHCARRQPRSNLIICLYLWPSYGVKTTFIALTTQTGTVNFYLLRFAKATHAIITYYLLLTNNCLWKNNS